jgi:hypothetical protein
MFSINFRTFTTQVRSDVFSLAIEHAQRRSTHRVYRFRHTWMNHSGFNARGRGACHTSDWKEE